MKSRLTEINYLIHYLKHGLNATLRFVYLRKPVKFKLMNSIGKSDND